MVRFFLPGFPAPSRACLGVRGALVFYARVFTSPNARTLDSRAARVSPPSLVCVLPQVCMAPLSSSQVLGLQEDALLISQISKSLSSESQTALSDVRRLFSPKMDLLPPALATRSLPLVPAWAIYQQRRKHSDGTQHICSGKETI